MYSTETSVQGLDSEGEAMRVNAQMDFATLFDAVIFA